MYKIILLPLAKNDIKEAALWYEKKQKGLGKRFISIVRKNTESIKSAPKANCLRYENVRTALLPPFPYMIHYSINEENKHILIIAVFHTSRRPEIWKDR